MKTSRKCSTKHPVAKNVQQSFSTMAHYDSSIAVVSPNKNSTVYVQHEAFPNQEHDFKQNFNVHQTNPTNQMSTLITMDASSTATK